MNCKPGDLAIIVRSVAGNEGKIVRCLRLAASTEILNASFPLRYGPMWVVDRPIMSTWGIPDCFAYDFNLRPIRDNDGEDETLTWAGKPSEVTA